MLASLLFAHLALANIEPNPSEEAGFAQWFFSAPGSNSQEFLVRIPSKPMETERVSPKNNWKFKWLFPGYARTPARPEAHTLRFRTYQQTRGEKDVAPLVTRALLQMYGMNVNRLRLEHHVGFFRQLVDVYLCDGGKAGGEQLFSEDPFNKDEYNRPQRTNQIYIYDLKSFTSPVEMLREIAHEYGHATLPPIGGFKSPEYWVNGHLGEVLYMTWFNRELKAGRIMPLDSLGVSSPELGKYVTSKIAPLAAKAAVAGPSPSLLAKRDPAALDHWLGLVLHMESMLPIVPFRRSLILSTQDPDNYAAAAVEAAGETGSQTFTIPAHLKGKKIWIPLGKGKLSGVKVLKSKQGWVQILPTGPTVQATFPKT